MSYFNKPEYDALKGMWAKEKVKEVAIAIRTEHGEIKVLGCPETGLDLWSEALRRKKRRTGEFLPKVNGQNKIKVFWCDTLE